MPRPSKSMQKWGITWKNDDKCWWMGMDHPTNDRTLSCWMTRSWPSSPAMNDGEVFGVNWVKSEFEGLTNQVWDLRGFIIESRERFVDHFADISNQSRCLDGIVLSFRPSTDCNSVDPTWFQICCWRICWSRKTMVEKPMIQQRYLRHLANPTPAMAMKGSESKVAAQLPLRSVRTEVPGMGFCRAKMHGSCG